MRTPALLALGLALATAATAADIRLINGRVLRDASVVGTAGETVTIQFAEGIEDVSKLLLPEPLRSQYSPDKASLDRAAIERPLKGLVMQLSGDGAKTSDTFRVSGRFRVRWSLVRKGPSYIDPWFVVQVTAGSGGLVGYASTEEIGEGETWCNATGAVSVRASGGGCSWAVFVDQF